MKVTPEKKQEVFEPVTIGITFESEDELLEFFCIFNFTGITDPMKHVDKTAIRRGLELANGGSLQYSHMFDKFKARFNKENNTSR